MTPRATALVVLAVTAPLAAGCGGGSDKAGGVTEPVTLRIAAHEYHNFAAKAFVDEVRRLPKGRIRIEFIKGTGEDEPADAAVRYARDLRDGRYDLGVIAAGVWDELGVTSLSPLQAPLLISDQSLSKAVATGPLADTMLAGLRDQHVIGLALMMGYLHHPMGFQGPLSMPADFRGKRIQVPVSRVDDAIDSAHGATPVHTNFEQLQRKMDNRELDGMAVPAFGPPGQWLTPNVTLFTDAVTVVVNEQRFAKLSKVQQEVLRTAAARAARGAAATITNDAPTDGKLVRDYCEKGHVAYAGEADLTAFEQATRPIYAQLERDPQVKETIAAIRALKQRTPRDPAPDLPQKCVQRPLLTHARVRDPSFLDGTYRYRLTREGAIRVGGDPNDPVVGGYFTVTLRGGKYLMEGSNGPEADGGTFTVTGDRIAFRTPHGYTNTFTFKRRGDGTLDLEPVLPMDIGDRVVTASQPWRRIGPPVRKIP
jgi:TRAP-type C4-dicarboxylate transport system substrate-binding protein